MALSESLSWPTAREGCPGCLSLAGLDHNCALLLRRTIDCFNRGHVAQTFHSIGFWVAFPVNRFREGVEFQSKFINHFELLLEPPASDLAEEMPLLFESKTRIQRCPALVTVDLQK